MKLEVIDRPLPRTCNALIFGNTWYNIKCPLINYTCTCKQMLRSVHFNYLMSCQMCNVNVLDESKLLSLVNELYSGTYIIIVYANLAFNLLTL